SPAPPPTGDDGRATTAASTEPDLGACPRAEPVEARIRTTPVPVPAAFDRIARSDMDHFAFATLGGTTVCVDTTWIESIDHAELSADGRFVAFDWLGYEAYGHVVVDRTGAGQVIDTGNAPFTSPDGKRLAAVDLSESGFGSLNAFAVWEIDSVGLRRLVETGQDLPPGDWRIDGWRGNHCVALSLVPFDRYPDDPADMDTVARDPWFAAESAGWQPAAGSCPRS
ncbi:MAG TPA: hypothetical protein VEB68_13925, partial [Croceibacterium sp.]|nr:hypothetical protein [Croceibacterium sp.]